MKPKIFVDGQEGTTGLRLHEYLAARTDLEILRIDPDQRKDPAARRRLINTADLVFLCLPDAASREAVALVENPRTCVIDASTAFRTDPAWAYGLPELNAAQRAKIKASKRIAVPGCHATAFLLAVFPLVQAGLLPADAALTCFSLTGYSGGGKKMIAAYEDPHADPRLQAPRPYALGLNHKHLPEMQVIAGLQYPPVFTPVVCPMHSGLAVEVPLAVRTLAKKSGGGGGGGGGAAEVHAVLAAHYAGEQFVRVLPLDAETNLDAGCLDITACNGTNRADILVCGNTDQVAVITRLDNLGKGASGAAIQCMNLVLGIDEGEGLPAVAT